MDLVKREFIMEVMKVCLKPTVLLYKNNPNKVVLRFCSEIIEFDDERGDIRFFFGLLCGAYTSKEILDEYAKKYPYDSGRARDYLDTLNELKLIELQPQDYSPLSDIQKERYSRNFEFFNSALPVGMNKYGIQSSLLDSRVVVLGCGGLGSHIILELAALGVGNLTIVDFDLIELSNLNRQILYREADLGRKKVFAARNNALTFNSSINITPVEKKIESVLDIKEIIVGHDLVICVADKPRNSMVKWLNEACCKAKIPYINGGLDIRKAVFYSVIPGETGCTECWKSFLPEQNRKVIDEDSSTQNDYMTPAPALSALVSVTTGAMICEAIKLLTDLQPPSLTNNLKTFSFDDLTITTTEKWRLNPECHCCEIIEGRK